MKKIFLIVSLLLTCLSASADKVTRTDDFKEGDSKFGFEATGTKKNSVTFDGEYMIVSSKKGWYTTGTRFPVVYRQNFKISYKLLIPKLDDKHIIGLVFNYDEDENKGDILYITENKFYICDSDGNKQGKDWKIKLKKGKDVEVTLEIEKKGRNTRISINGVDFDNEDLLFRSSYMGFTVNEKNTLKVDEIRITQNLKD